MGNLSPEDKCMCLRGCGLRVGYTDGQPESTMTISMFSGRDFDLYHLSEIEKLMEYLAKVAPLGSLSPTDMFVLHWLKQNAVLSAYQVLSEVSHG